MSAKLNVAFIFIAASHDPNRATDQTKCKYSVIKNNNVAITAYEHIPSSVWCKQKPAIIHSLESAMHLKKHLSISATEDDCNLYSQTQTKYE